MHKLFKTVAAATLAALMTTASHSANDAGRAPAPKKDRLELVVFGAPNCCCECDCKSRCKKHSRIVCEMKKIKKHRWKCECEDFCTMVPGEACGLEAPGFLEGCKEGSGADCSDCCDAACGDSCGEGCCEDACGCGPRPELGRCRTVKRLVKVVYTVEVPVYKCVVEYCCPGCSDVVADRAAGAKKVVEQKEDPAKLRREMRLALLPKDEEGYGE